MTISQTHSNIDIDVTVMGGTGVYWYNWSHGAFTEDVSGLGAGTYSVVVTDENGCSVSIEAELGGIGGTDELSGCVVPGACNYVPMPTQIEACIYPVTGYDCDGNQLDCSGESMAMLSWVGDGYCDDGSFGQYLDCETFNFDNGDCGHCADSEANNYGSIANCDYDITTCNDTSACNYGQPGNCMFADTSDFMLLVCLGSERRWRIYSTRNAKLWL